MAIGARARAGVDANESVEVATLVGSRPPPGADDGGMRRGGRHLRGAVPSLSPADVAKPAYADEVEDGAAGVAFQGDTSPLAEGLVPEGLIDRMSLPVGPGSPEREVGRIPGGGHHVCR